MHNGDASVHLNVNGTSGYLDGELEHSESVAETLPSTIGTEPTPAPTAVPVAVAAASTANDVIDQNLETITDNQLAAVLRQETPVDDDDHDQLQPQLTANNDRNSDTNGINASSAAVTTIAVNISPAEEPPSQSQPQVTVEPVEQVENNVSASVIVSVSATAAEIVPVA